MLQRRSRARKGSLGWSRSKGTTSARAGRMLLMLAGLLASLVIAPIASANTTPQTLPFTQNWSNTGLITTDDNWSNVPGIIGYRGDDLTTGIDTHPTSVTADGSGTPVDVNPNRTDPDTFTTGGVTEFELSNPTVALQSTSTADAPHLVFFLNTTGQANIDVSVNLRDIDGSADDAVQPVALAYKVGNNPADPFSYVNYVNDATSGPNLATQETTLAARLPSDANDQPVVQVRVIVTNSTGADEWVGVDDISATSALPLNAVRISEFRTGGATDTDEFVELTNRSSQTVDISNVLVNVCGGVFGAGPTGIVGVTGLLDPGESYLAVTGDGYAGALDANKSPNAVVLYGSPGGSGDGYGLSMPNGALFDQVGYAGSACAEGTGLPAPTAAGNYSFVRRAGFNSLPDTNNNAADFDFISDTGGTFGPVSALGIPGPENSNDPRRLFAGYSAAFFDTGASGTATPNRVIMASDPRNPPKGVLRLRRRFTNTGTSTITDLNFRIYLLNTKNSPPGTTRADLRSIDSEAQTIVVSGTPRDVASTVVQGSCPGAEPECHGLNTRLTVDLSGVGDELASGASVDFSLDFAIERGGAYTVAFFPEVRTN